MRTHTSPGQIRAMREYCPEPIRVILPGKCYRYEQITARSEHQFYQVEGLAVGKGIRMTDLIGVLYEFAHRMYGASGRLRIRASYFPFTEPSIEADMSCILCGGKGCAVCKRTGWLEIAGAGMVHPVVLRNGGYDPDVYTGFAFGCGVERPSMLKYGINDIRYFYGNDLRFLSSSVEMRCERSNVANVHNVQRNGSITMKVPLSWLKDFVDITLPLDRLAERLTLARAGGGIGDSDRRAVGPRQDLRRADPGGGPASRGGPPGAGAGGVRRGRAHDRGHRRAQPVSLRRAGPGGRRSQGGVRPDRRAPGRRPQRGAPHRPAQAEQDPRHPLGGHVLLREGAGPGRLPRRDHPAAR